MTHEPDPLEERLRRLRLADPDPALRWRTLHGAREVLDRRAAVPQWWLWLRSWRPEAALVAAVAAVVVVCLLILPWLNGSLDPRVHGHGRQPCICPPPGEPEKPAADQETATELELDEALQPYVRFRLAISQRDREAERRYQYHETRWILARGEV